MHHLEPINQDIKRRWGKDKDSTVNKTEYRSKRNPTGGPRQTAKASGPTISSIDKSLANLFIMGNYFNELRCKIIRASNLLQFIHQVAIEFRFRKSLAQERFKANLEFRYQIIVSSIKFRKGFVKFDTDGLVYEVSKLTIYCECWSQ